MVVFGLVHLLGDYLFECVGGFERWNVVSWNNECGVLADVAGCLLGTGLDDERTEATEIYVFTVCEAVLDNGHKLFDNGNNRSFVNAGCFCDFTCYFCLEKPEQTGTVRRRSLGHF